MTAQRVKKHEQTPRRGQPGEPGASNDSMHDLRHQAEWRAQRRTNVESVCRLPHGENHSAQPITPPVPRRACFFPSRAKVAFAVGAWMRLSLHETHGSIATACSSSNACEPDERVKNAV